MKIDFFRAGIDSLEMSMEHLSRNTDRDLRAAILLGFHGVVSLLKAAAAQQGISVNQGSRSIEFPQLVGALKVAGWVDKAHSKALHVCGLIRNALEHQEADYDRIKFQAALHGVLPIVERIARDYAGTDLQDELSPQAWQTLLDIETFFEHRAGVLDTVVEQVLVNEVGWGKDRLISSAQAAWCDQCSTEGLPWQGTHREKVTCRLCGEVSIVVACNWCSGPVAIQEDDEWPHYHDECLRSYLDRD